MLDNHHEPDNRHEADNRMERELPVRPSDDTAPASDREVPLTTASSNDVIHRWLDGEDPEPTGLRGDAARSVEFWRRLSEETDKRRRVATPANLSTKIMAALPSVDRSVVVPASAEQ